MCTWQETHTDRASGSKPSPISQQPVLSWAFIPKWALGGPQSHRLTVNVRLNSTLVAQMLLSQGTQRGNELVIWEKK